MTVMVALADYKEACESYTGWCTECEAFTTGCVEPDAEGYTCEACGESTVVGAEDALITGVIVFEE